jgi:hypothetical protein
VLFLLAIVLSVLLQFTDSDYPFGIFKLFFTIHFYTQSPTLTLPEDLMPLARQILQLTKPVSSDVSSLQIASLQLIRL